MVLQAPRRPLQRVGEQLVVGPASAADDPDMPYCPTGFRPGGMRIDGATMSTVAQMLSLPPGRVLLGTITVDRTGLTGRYTLDLDYLFTGAEPPPDFAGPSLPTAIKEQWGLRWCRARGASSCSSSTAHSRRRRIRLSRGSPRLGHRDRALAALAS